ncbi:putative nuclear cap binding complex subunit CBP30 [Trypanosoma grayi]|uniref:putative nuclear cap binding complex subunit CBP30 n=1 Tax=Trypanosoma grayi TaxID=71804 RepID=UPI0004F42A11|nr:putative nuclear cap binding complex subunit CBP30 [Trypanosoma grayi]KEG12435.1 putative nuclear cap binding complex subunit CBP30 [Trypanosoma grayi]
MPRGSGFVHLNTPAAISYSPGQQVSLSDLRHTRSREECVVLPHTIATWRSAFQKYVKSQGMSQFVGDIEAEREGEGPILPPLAGPPAAAVATTTRARPGLSKEPQSSSSAAADAVDIGVEDASCSSTEKGIMIVSHHKLSGERRFVYPDHDGVLSAGIVPQVVISAEEKAELEADRRHYISSVDMSDDERAALEELQSLWKSRAHSRSVQGTAHRAAAGTAVPGGDAIATEEGERNQDNNGGHSKRARLEPLAEGAARDSEANTGNMLDDALRLAGELLDLS